MRRTVGHIPRNLGGGTLLDGRIKMRNAVEAVIVAAIVYGFTKILELFIPYLVAVAIRVIMWLLFCGITVVGIGGEPLSVYILNMMNYSNSRTYVTLRPPLREAAVEEKPKKKTLSDRIFVRPGRRNGK